MSKMHHREQFYDVPVNTVNIDEYLFNVHFVFAFLIFAQNQFYWKVHLISVTPADQNQI